MTDTADRVSQISAFVERFKEWGSGLDEGDQEIVDYLAGQLRPVTDADVESFSAKLDQFRSTLSSQEERLLDNLMGFAELGGQAAAADESEVAGFMDTRTRQMVDASSPKISSIGAIENIKLGPSTRQFGTGSGHHSCHH